MYLEQRNRRGAALAPVTTAAATMVLAAVAALVVAASGPSVAAVALVVVALLALGVARATAPRALAWWQRPAPPARRLR